MSTGNIYRFFFLIAAICLCSLNAEAQKSDTETYSYEFRGEALEQILDRVARDTETDLVYDPEIVKGHTIFKRVKNESVANLLRDILADVQLDYLTLSSGTIVIVKSVAEEPGFGTFAGKIVDRQTGEPLPGATVMLADAEGGTSAGKTGNFTLNKLISGNHTIIFSYIGYEPVSRIVEIQPDQEHRETISLRQKPVDVLPIVVESHRPQMTGINTDSQMKNNLEWEPTGIIRDPIRDLNLMAGIQYGLPMSDLHMQGGQQSEHRIMLDGVPVYQPYSIGRLFSSFSPFAIGDVRLQKAGYGAGEGSQIAGLIDLRHEMPALGEKRATIQADPLSINLKGDLSFQFNDDESFSVMSAFRTNYWDLYKDPVLEQSLRQWDVIDPLITNMTSSLNEDASFYTPVNHQSEVDFFDLHFSSRYKIDSYQSITGSFYASENSLGTDVLNQVQPGESKIPYLFAGEDYNWKNRVGQLKWNNMISPRFDLSIGGSYSTSRFSHESNISLNSVGQFSRNAAFSPQPEGNFVGDFIDSGFELPTQVKGNNIQHMILQTDFTYSFTTRVNLDGGFQFDRISSDLSLQEDDPLSDVTAGSSSLFSSYFTGHYRFGTYWHLSGGSRFTYLDETSSVYAEPRISVQYDRPDSKIGYWSGQLSAGLYRQFINEYQVTNTGASAVVPSFSIWSHAGRGDIPKAWHINNSWLFEPSGNSTIRLEFYYKWQPVTNITAYHKLENNETNNKSGVGAFAESTDMRAAGAGLRMNRNFLDSRFSVMAGYDYSYTRINLESQFGRMLPAPWNEPHRSQLRAIWRVVPDLSLAAKWHATWGRTWAFRDSYYNYVRFSDQLTEHDPAFTHPENDRLRPFSQVDLSMIYQPAPGNTDLEIRLDLINLLNRKNSLDQNLIPLTNQGEITGSEVRERTLPGFYPTVSVEIQF